MNDSDKSCDKILGGDHFADIDKMTFEQALSELETIVGKLDQGNVALEESISIYERGEKLRTHCERLLKKAEMRMDGVRLDQNGDIDDIAAITVTDH